MKISLGNFNSQNTPVNIQTVGNWLLIAGVIGGGIIILPATLPALVLPAAVLQIGYWMAGLGSLGKLLTKFTGVSNATELAPLVEQTNKQLDKQTDDTVATTPIKIAPPTNPPTP